MSTIVLGVIGSDAHVVGITLIEHALIEEGYDVENIGVQSSQDEFIEAATDTNADAILVSSLYGHAEQDCAGFISKLEDTDLDVATYIGGNLSVGSDTDEQLFYDMGFDRVFSQDTDVDEVIDALTEDITEQSTERDRVTV